MRPFPGLIGLCFALCLWMLPQAARAEVDIKVDMATQTMTVRSGNLAYVWPVSTARAGYVTPRGKYRPQALVKMHYSRKYNMSPMPHSIFYNGGYAIHGTNDVRNLGRPASHGCVRLSKANAAILFALVKAEGATIAINGASPRSTMLASAKKKAPVLAKTAPSRTLPATALGYAPAPSVPALKTWSQNPGNTTFLLR